MLEITSDDIAGMNDEDLRSLVALLCESEARRRGLSTASITWGGNQTAADGGLDVRVAFPEGTDIEGFVPKAATGFQVKTPDMPRGAIHKEMRPDGVLRPAIRELADESGAYIIVSSKGSTSDAALRNRREAMAEAVKDLPNRSSLTLDFYDRTRLATWLRDHPGLIPWVRTKIGKAIKGWTAYGPWAYEPDGMSGEYLIDEKLRVHSAKNDSVSGFSSLEGIKQIRDLLREPGKVVRLIGLSGVGKTRFLQALFDDRVGENSLDPSLAIYTNMADEPDPQPTGLTSDLIADRTRAIVVIDNCASELHRRISELCRSSDSTVSAITVEYDIREDEPEGTEIFRLEPASIELIEKLIRHRFSTLSTVDSHTIAEFSGGNARIGIALASTIRNDETISSLTDEELFQRLFVQRHSEDEPLMLVAQACSLVYSFEGQDVSNSDPAELVRLGAMIGKNAQEVFRAVAELHRRDLVQHRGIWRAVLPQAIANRLAALALENIPLATIEAQLIANAPVRLVKSFSRRLGYLHDSKEAVALIENWLATDGILGNVVILNEVGEAMLNNVAAAAPSAVLAAFERSLFGPAGDKAIESCAKYVRLIRSLAYDSTIFDRCIALLLKLEQGAAEDGKSSNAATVFASLFFLYLSGTHATIEQRLGIIEALLLSEDRIRRNLGLKALKAALETGPFTSEYQFEFGARSRDHGYWPRTASEVKHWYRSVLTLAQTFACTDRSIAAFVRLAVAREFRGLWNVGMYEELENLCRAVSGTTFWPDGWIAIRETLSFDSERFAPEIVARLSLLERHLRHKNVVQKVRAMVLSDSAIGLELDKLEDNGVEDLPSGLRRNEAIARRLGKAVATDEEAFEALIEELVVGRGHITSFGQGLLEGSPDPKATWDRLVAQFAKAKGERSVQIFVGFISALQVRDSSLASALLDNAVTNDTLAPWYPVLQAAVRIDPKGLERIGLSLAIGKAPLRRYEHLAWTPEQIAAPELRELVLTIAAKPDGFQPALEILDVRIHSDDRNKQGHATEIIDTGRQLLRQVKFTKKRDSDDYRFETISKACLVGEEGAEVAREVCRRLKGAVAKYETYGFYNGGLLAGLLAVQPAAVLDALCSGDTTEIKKGIRILEVAGGQSKNLLDVVPGYVLLDWCDKEPENRYPIVGGSVTWSFAADEAGPRRWTKIALDLLKNAPDRVEVLRAFLLRLRPMSWSGSRATVMESNLKLLDELEGFSDPIFKEFVAQEKVRFREEIDAERRKERITDRTRDERFE
jgi:hypothetical protein